MQQLHAVQREFWNSLRSRRADPACTRLFSEDGEITRKKRLEIYRSTMRTAHVRALANTYPCCEKILGGRYFRQMATEYFHGHPATHQNLNLYGGSFPEFLRNWGREHEALAEYPYLPDLAKLEWAYEQAYYASEDPEFDFDRLSTLHEDDYRNICFRLSASLSLLDSIYPVYEIWTAQQAQEEVREVEAIAAPQYLCIAREHYKPVIHRLGQNYWWVMQEILNGTPFGELESLVQQEHPHIPLQVIIPELISQQWVCGYRLMGQAG